MFRECEAVDAAPIVDIQTMTSSLGRGGGQVVSVLAFYSDDPSSTL